MCNFSEATAHQKFHKIFRDGFSDEALSNAIMLSLTFAANEYHFTQECVSFKNTTIRHINQKMGSSLDPPTVSQMIGAILLLIGVEVSILQPASLPLLRTISSGDLGTNHE